MDGGNTSLIQWNCRGLSANRPELDILTQITNASVICLQETLLKDDKYNINNFTPHHKLGTIDTEGRAHGGVSIFVRDSIKQYRIHLVSPMQAVAVRTTINHPITICSVYIPPSSTCAIEDLEDLLQQLPTPIIMVGDFNAHNILWGGNKIDQRGNIMEAFITRNNLCLWNDDSFTYMHPATGSLTSIDLSLCSPGLLLDFQWKVEEDLHGSDHFPIVLRYDQLIPEERIPRWQFHKAKWDKFASLCESELQFETFKHLPDPVKAFTDHLNKIAESCIPKSSGVPKRPDKPWFNEECKEAINERKKALDQFRKNSTSENLQALKIWRAKARRTIRKCKRNSWREFISKLNSRSPIKKCWDMVRKINGKRGGPQIQYLEEEGTKVTNPKDIADILASTIAKNSSTANYTSKFQRNKIKKERKQLNFISKNLEEYNKAFSLEELVTSIKKSHDTTPGPDQIHYQILKHLPLSTCSVLLEILNLVWENGNFPTSWKEATMIPIPKPDKDSTNKNNHRPISLTSCICKTMERMINERLVWFLETSGIITKFQSGFRWNRSTLDHLVRFETLVRETFLKKEHLVAIFFDLEKAYDTVWKYGIMKDLHDMGLRGRLPIFIESFLSDRTFRVRVGNVMSNYFEQENGVPQGSILSVTLFSIKINSIVEALKPGVDCGLYVDDFQISYRSKNIHTIERQLQLCLNKLQDWADENGFKFSKSKTVCMHFCQLRKQHADPELYLEDVRVPVVEQAKFLGLIFDRKLSFIPHLKYLRKKCQKALNFLRVVAHTDWGSDRMMLLQLYKSLIRSKLDYGSIVYGSARKSYLQMLDPIQNQALRLCLGAFRTSPAKSLQVEAEEPSLENRRLKLAIQYVTKMAANPDNPTSQCIFSPDCEDLFVESPNSIPPIGIRVKTAMQDLEINLENIAEFELPQTPIWSYSPPPVNFELSKNLKKCTDPNVFISAFQEVKDVYKGHEFIYTDGSKMNARTASAAVMVDHAYQERLPDKASIFTAELNAIFLALDHVETSSKSDFVIFTDSKSCLQSLASRDWKNPMVLRVLERYYRLCYLEGKAINFCWIPSHIGIKGNEKADTAAKLALNLKMTEHKVPYTDYRCYTNRYTRILWQHEWDDEENNKLHSVCPIIGLFPAAYRRSRREEVVLARSRIGHTFYTHSYLLRGEEQPECVICDCPLTVKHILLDCVDFDHIRSKYFNVDNMQALFEQVNASLILDYIREIGLFHKF